MNMTLKEKSTWLSLVATLVIFGAYTFKVLSIDMQTLSQQEATTVAMANLSSAVLFIIIVEVIFQSVIAAAGSKEKVLEDERDSLVSYKANNSGYWVLSIGVIVTLGQLLLPHVIGIESSLQSRFPIPLFEVHLLLFVFILSEITRFGHQIILYRQDAV